MDNNQSDRAAKTAIITTAITTNSPFKSAFMATLGFFAAQTVMTFLGILVIVLIFKFVF